MKERDDDANEKEGKRHGADCWVLDCGLLKSEFEVELGYERERRQVYQVLDF